MSHAFHFMCANQTQCIVRFLNFSFLSGSPLYFSNMRRVPSHHIGVETIQNNCKWLREKEQGYLLPSPHQYPFMGVSMTGRWNTGCQSQSAHIIFFPNIIGKISLNSIWLNTLQPKPAVTPLNHLHTAPKPTDS